MLPLYRPSRFNSACLLLQPKYGGSKTEVSGPLPPPLPQRRTAPGGNSIIGRIYGTGKSETGMKREEVMEMRVVILKIMSWRTCLRIGERMNSWVSGRMSHST